MPDRVEARERNRLTDDDRKAIDNHIVATLEQRRLTMDGQRWPQLSANDLVELRRSSYRAIGCTDADLRDVELEEIDAMVLSAALMVCVLGGNHAASPAQMCSNCGQRGGI